MPTTFGRILGLLLLIVTLQATPALASTRVYVGIAPPVAVVESRPPAPYRGYVWRPGYHRWRDHHYQWVHGAWVRPPYQRAVWVPGHWAHTRRGYYWVNGYWTRR
jgi:WXXGXW repeat (2 copies)